MHHAHQPVFTVLSVVIAVAGSWTALDLARRVDANAGRARLAWRAGAALGLGLSIWSMHFVAMLGYDPGAPVSYAPGPTLLSLALAIVATGGAFLAAPPADFKLQWRFAPPPQARLVGAGVFMGVGICAMHYVGMSAMRMDGVLRYDPWLVALSLVIAVGASISALAAARGEQSLPRKIGAAVILGFAIVGMHYTGMAAVRFIPAGMETHVYSATTPLIIALGVAGATLMVLCLSLAAAVFDRRFAELTVLETAALRRSEERMRAVLEQMPLGVIIAEAPNGRLAFSNAEAARLMGHTPPPAESWRDYTAHHGFHTDGRPLSAHEYPLSRVVLQGEHVSRELHLYRQPGGRIASLEVSAAPVRDSDGRLVLGVLAMQDVTDKLEAEAALRQAQRLEGVGQLTGGVAHDFNNLLTAVIGGLDLALKRIEDERARRLVTNALHAAQRGAKLTAQLLAFSRRQRLETRAVDLNALIAGMSDLLTSTLGGAIKVEHALAADLPLAVVDPAQVELALLNLAINARDAMGGDGVITLATRAVSLGEPGGLHEPEPGDYVMVSVRDEGSGMTPDVLARAVEPFFTTKPVGKGSGLGLSQVAGLAKQLGGGLRIDSALGFGTEVMLFAPRAAAGVAEPSGLAEGPAVFARPAPPMNVLVVEDDHAVRAYVCELLREAGHGVVGAAGGAEALARLQGGLRPDVLLADFAMPGMTGAELLRQARALLPGLPGLIMTGYLDREALPVELQAEDLLQKPFEPRELFDRLVRAAEAARV